jgi:hypothetical protein
VKEDIQMGVGKEWIQIQRRSHRRTKKNEDHMMIQPGGNIDE